MTWEVRGGQVDGRYSVERGCADDDLEVAARDIYDYGLACLIEAACNFHDGTVE